MIKSIPNFIKNLLINLFMIKTLFYSIKITNNRKAPLRYFVVIQKIIKITILLF